MIAMFGQFPTKILRVDIYHIIKVLKCIITEYRDIHINRKINNNYLIQ